MEITIREAIPTDALKLSVLFKQVYIQTYGKEGVSDEFANFITRQFSPEIIEMKIQHTPDNIHVAAYKDNLVGVVELEWEKQCPVGDLIAPELNKLYILEWFCGRGIGHQLLAAAEETVLSKGITTLWLWVLESNERAIQFYEKQQYQWIGNASFQMEVNRYENKVMVKQLPLPSPDKTPGHRP